MSKIKTKSYVAVIVAYHPNLDHLIKMTNELLDANIRVVIYDNTPESDGYKNSCFNNERVHILANGINDGLGRAFNSSIEFLELNSLVPDAVMFFDQDSFVESDKLNALINELEWLQAEGWPIGVLGARPVDQSGNEYSVRKLRNASSDPLPDAFSAVSFVISSFSIVPFEVFQKVGMFDEKLFIDLVDSEFSYRCSSHGLLNLTSRKTSFIHVIGESRKTFFGRTFSISSARRNYYQARNLIIVGRDYHWYWFMFSGVFRRFIQVVLSGFYEKDLRIRLKYFFKGVCHGLIYRTGGL